eukprot:TRINITY_DN20136_c0_g1_i1.p1 TRINITY_DN20136_c0_g1~~TRINITY_DN20136_c0_g1_i1.p1  ORF type:complete len:157 (+),score=6.52 TRINITY_DN20136_c0_g1_i1:67-471(+)
MPFASMFSLVVLLYVGQGYRIRQSLNTSKVVSDLQGEARENQKDVAAKESHTYLPVTPSTRPSHERVHSFADLSTNTSGGSNNHQMYANDSSQGSKSPELQEAVLYEDSFRCFLLVMVGMLVVACLACICTMCL